MKKIKFYTHYTEDRKTKLKIEKVEKTDGYSIGNKEIDKVLVDNDIENAYNSDVILNKGFYDSVEELLNDINEGFITRCPITLVSFSINSSTKRIQMKLSKLVSCLTVSKRLALFLGFAETTFFSENIDEFLLESDSRLFEAKDTFDLNQGSTQVYIYCNIVSSQIVGDMYAQLLHTLPVNHNQGSVLVENPSRSYITVDKLKFNGITILICNEFVEIIDFDH